MKRVEKPGETSGISPEETTQREKKKKGKSVNLQVNHPLLIGTKLFGGKGYNSKDAGAHTLNT